MDFIVDNYFWFIVGGIVLLMIIIGYIAEKTDFGRKPFREKKTDNKEIDAVNEEIVEDVVAVGDQEVVPETGDSDNFMMGAELELPEESVNEDDSEVAKMVEEPEEVAEIPAENVAEEPMVDLDIPEIEASEEEVAPEVPSVVEDVIADDSEDDVWKF